MRKIKRIPVTREGYEKLIDDLRVLKESRPDAVNTLSDARKMGDLSENGLYTAAKMRLRSIDSQIFRINIQIKLADIIEDKRSDVVALGSRVSVYDGNVERTFKIVGDYEADPKRNMISRISPIGKSLIGKKEGESLQINIPSGRITYKILKID